MVRLESPFGHPTPNIEVARDKNCRMKALMIKNSDFVINLLH